MKKFVLMLVCLFSLTVGYSQDAGTYSWTTATNGSFVDMSSGTTDIFATGTYHDDDPSSIQNIGFTFTFAGSAYTQFSVNSNGQIQLGATAISGTSASPTSLKSILAPISGDNSLLSTGKVHMKVTGTDPSQVLVIEFVGLRIPYGSTGTGSQMQVLLHQSTNVIEYIYGAMYNNSTSATNRGVFISNGTSAGQVGNVTTIPTTPAFVSGASLVTSSFAASSNMTNLDGTIDGARRVFTFTPATCFPPTAVTASAVTTNSATISWTAATPAPANGYQYEVRTSGAAGSGATGLFASGTTIAGDVDVDLTGLTQATPYFVYVRSDCGAGDNSGWSAACSFTTACGVISTFPYTESFSATMNPCWSVSEGSAGASYHWATTTANASYGVSGPQSGTHFAYLNVFNASDTYNTYNLTTSTFSLDAVPKQISYYYWLGSSGYTLSPVPLALEISTDNGATWTNLYQHTTANSVFSSSSDLAGWNQNTVNLGAYVNQTVIFRFVSNSNYGSGYCNQALDEVMVKDAPNCIMPSALTTTAITTTTATIAWTASASAVNGYQYEVRTSGAAGSGATGLIVADVTAAGVVSANITGLSANTYYYVYVRSDCGSGDFSEWTGAYTFFTGYCIPAPSSVDGEGITNVSFSTVNNTTSTEVGNYGDFSAMVGDVVMNTTVPVLITFETGYTYDTKIWIDWNDNFNFTDAGDEVYSGTSLGDDSTVLAASFLVPISALPGNHRMRIGALDNGPATPCYSGTYGTFEDYTINVVVPPAPSITGLDTTSGCAGTSLLINGDNFTGVSEVTIGGTTAAITANTDTTVVVTIGSGTTGTVTVTTGGGSATSTETFTVFPLPQVFTVSGGGAYCAGDSGVSITLNGSEAGIEYTLSTTPDTTMTGTGSALTFGPLAFATGDYSITATNVTSGCSVAMTGNAIVSINPIPSAVIASASSNSICPGVSVDLSASATSNAFNADTVTEDFESGSLANWTFINAGTGNAWDTVASNAHSTSHSLRYNYNSASPADAWAITQPFALTAGRSCTVTFWYKVGGSSFPEKLKVTAGNGATVADQTTTLWDNNGEAGLTNTVYEQGTITFTPSTSGNYNFGFNCYSEADMFTLYIDDISVSYSVPALPTYSWTSSPAGFTSTDQNPTGVVPAATTQYTVTAENAHGCTASANTTVTVNAAPVVSLGADTTICVNNTLVLDAANAGATYLWAPDGQTTQTVSLDSTNLDLGANTIKVTVTANGCSASDSIVVTMNACAGMSENDDNVSVSIMPNPSNGMFYLTVDGLNEATSLNIYSVNGQVVYSEKFEVSVVNQPIDLKSFPKGVYFLRLVSGNTSHIEKIVVE